MGEAQVLPFRVVLQDDGSVKLVNFENQLQKTTGVAKKSGNKMTRAFSRIGRGIKSVGRSVFSLKGLLVGLAGSVVIRGFFNLLRAAGKQEDAVNKLNSALRTAGVFTQEFSNQQQALASSLQAQTRFGDEAILAAQSLLITYGVTTDKLKEATQATLDFATATGRDLNTAALTVGKAAAGFTGELGRYGIIIDTKAIPKTEIFQAVLDKMNQQFGGRAQADVNTFSGRMQQLSNLFGDFQEQLGFAVINSVKFRARLKDLSDGLVLVNKETGSFLGTGLGDALADLIPTAKALSNTIFGVALTLQRFVIVGKSAIVFFKLFKVGVLVARGVLVVLGDFISRRLNQTFVIITQTIADFIADTLELLILTLNEVGQAMIDTGVKGVAPLGVDIVQLGRTTGEALISISEFSDNIEKAGRSNQKTSKSVREAAVAIRLAKKEAQESVTSLDASVRAFENLGKAAEKSASGINKGTKAFSGFLDVQDAFLKRPADAKAFPQIGLELDPTINQKAAAVTDAQRQIEAGFAQLTDARAQIIAESVDFQKAAEDKKLQIIRDAITDEATLRKAANLVAIQGTATLVGSIANLLEASGSANFKTIKKFRIAEAIIAGILAVQEALASPPGPPFTIPLAAAIAAQTAANVAAIRSTQPGGGAGGGGVGAVGGGAMAGGGGPAAPGEIQPVAVQAEPTGPARISITVSGFIGDEGELGSRIVALVRDAQEDGNQLDPVT